MTKFNPHNKILLTYGEILRPAMDITEQDDADQYFDKMVRFTEKQGNVSREKAEAICLQIIMYYARMCSEETYSRIRELFNKKK